MTFKEIIEKKNNALYEIVEEVDWVIENAEAYKTLLENNQAAKKETHLTDYQYAENIVNLYPTMDRSHPVPTVIINDFKDKTGADVEGTKIIHGIGADEYTRMHHALALVVANTIFFRNGAYRPETEEGRKLLAHELTHVAQNKDKESYRNTTKAEMEAEQAEKREEEKEQEDDPLITHTVGFREYTLKKSDWQDIKRRVMKKLDRKVFEAKYQLKGQEYLSLLLRYKEWLENAERSENSWLK